MKPSPAPGRDRLFLSVREQIADRIRNDVLGGRFAAGERLLENKLGEEFGVSRTPIREALQQLTTEGILEGRANTGVKVAQQENYANPLDIHAEHVQIVKAFRSGDVEAAVALLQEKIN